MRDIVTLGIDPGTTGMGYAVVAGVAQPRLVTCGIVAAPAGRDKPAQLLAIASALDALITAHGPAAMALERLYFNKNVRTAMAVSEARGVALLCAARAGIAVAEYTPQEVKIAVTGSGAADKKQVQRMLALLLPLEQPIAQDNVADAVAIALTHAGRAALAAVIETA